ncbi:MAG TPA: peptidoglycan -binding protein [Gammaproteobacteria bacterium]|nr:peptidoglycan -binding protein [Gammaproteobacteria bacterium]
MLIAGRRRHGIDIWPGFVDALSALLMVVVFVLLLFSVGQYLLTDALVGRDQALDRLHSKISALAEVLALERKEKAKLEQQVTELNGRLQATVAARDSLQARLAEVTAQADSTAASLEQTRSELATARQQIEVGEASLEQQRQTIAGLEGERDRLRASLDESEQARSQQQQLTQQAQDKVAELGARIAALTEQLARVNQALEAAEASVAEKDLRIEDLGRRLNVALANKVEELARYRSEFFGKLRQALKDNPDIHVEGDRFVLPSEVLFSSASADLDKQGREQIAAVAHTLKAITEKIPDDIDWVLRVDGHTDKRPIRKAFKSNWELSSARAISIVKYLIHLGIPANRLVAAGFGPYHPLDPADTPEAYRRNRRIELKLTSR